MYQLSNALEKNLEAHYTEEVSLSSENLLHIIYFNDKQYFLRKDYTNLVGLLLKTEIEKRIKLEDEEFYVAGGSVLSLIMYGTPFAIRDIDIFPKTEQEFLKLKEKLKKATNEFRETENSICFVFPTLSIDLIKKYYDTLENCLRNFDLSVVKMGFDSTWKFHYLASAFQCFEYRMSLTTQINSKNAFALFQRVLKYSQKGFKLDKESIIKLFSVIKSRISDVENNTELATYNEIYQETSKEYNKKYHVLDSFFEPITVTKISPVWHSSSINSF